MDRKDPRVHRLMPTGATRDRTPTISAIVTDRHSAVTAGDLELVVDGKQVRGVDYVARKDRMTWTPDRALSPGRHTVRLVAEDALGNRTVTKWRFTVRR